MLKYSNLLLNNLILIIDSSLSLPNRTFSLGVHRTSFFTIPGFCEFLHVAQGSNDSKFVKKVRIVFHVVFHFLGSFNTKLQKKERFLETERKSLVIFSDLQ